jgi:hypothetical protein
VKPSNSRDELLALLQKQIEERETAREEILKSIQILKEAERELRQKGAAPLRQDEEQADHLSYRIHSGPGRAFDPQDELDDIKLLKKEDTPKTPTGRGIEIEEGPSLLQEPPSNKREAPPPSQSASSIPMDDILQDEQISLLGGGGIPAGEPRTPPEDRPARNRPDPFMDASEPDLDVEIPRPAPGKLHTNGGPHRIEAGPKKPLPEAIDQLMNYIRGGGAVRCQDPWGQNCAAFLIGENGVSVLATDVFLNYLRKSIQHLRRLHEEYLVESASSPLNTAKLVDLESRKRFLRELGDGLAQEKMAALRDVTGLKITGPGTSTETFAFENSTRDFLHSGFLSALSSLLEKSTDSFFRSGGPYFEIADFLGQYKNFTRETGEEKMAVAMLEQLGIRAGAAESETAHLSPSPPASEPKKFSPPPAPPEEEVVDLTLEDEVLELDEPEEPGITPPDPNEVLELEEPEEPGITLPDPNVDTSSFLEESDHLQDLNTFDFDPSDKKSIMAQQEDALSMSKFKGGKAKPPSGAPSIEVPPSGSESTESAFNIGDISPSGEIKKPAEEEYKLTPEVEDDEAEPFSLEDLENLLDDEG